MKNKSKNICSLFILLSTCGASSFAFSSDTYVFRKPISESMMKNGVITDSGSNNNSEEGSLEGSKEDIKDDKKTACYQSENIGSVGTESPCLDMLIVDRSMLKNAANHRITRDAPPFRAGRDSV